MKRLHYAVFFAVFVFATLKVQSQDTSSTESLIRYILQPLDKSQVPTAFLEEYGAPIVPMTSFNGNLSDSNIIDMNVWRTLYFQLWTGYCGSGSNPLPSITTVNNSIGSLGSTETVSIPILIGEYNTVKSYAFTNNLLTHNISTNQVHDVPGRPESPYQLNNLFAASPVKSYSNSGSVSFIVRSDHVWNNSNKTISQIQINFNNNQGFQTVSIDVPIHVNYSDTGTKRWTIKVTMNDNSVLQCYSDYRVVSIGGLSRFTVPCAQPGWAAAYTQADIRVCFSVREPSGTLRKPLIVVEGFDISSVFPYPNYNVESFIESIESINGYDFNNRLDNIAGYDLVFIDFFDGTASIVDNAEIVEDVIELVNLNKVFDVREGRFQQNVVMGISMGGLCARYALAEMTKSNQITDTRLLITHDSPHRGANVPLGLQHLVHMIGGVELFGLTVRDIYPQYDNAIGLLDRPATQQLLLNRATGPTSFASNTFLDGDYRSTVTFTTADPQPTYRFIATSLGSECGIALYQPYTKLLDVDINGYIFYFPLASYRLRSIVEGFALPSQGLTNKIARLKIVSSFRLFGWLPISKDVYNTTAFAPGNQVPVDGAPGATSPFTREVPNINFGFPLFGLFGYLGYVSVNVNGTPTRFSFVPVVSALDVNPFNTAALSQSFVNGTNQNYPSRAATFIAHENGATPNNEHIVFTPRNAEWIFNEMEEQPNNLNCSPNCFNAYYINGPSELCTAGNYSIPGLQRGASVTWTVNNGSVSLSCTNCDVTTLTRNFSGQVTLTANIFNSCAGVGPIQVTKQITVSSAPTQYTLTALYSTEGFSGYLSDVNCLKTYTFPGFYSGEISLSDQVATSYTWTFVSKTPSTAYVSIFYNDPRYATVTVKPAGAAVTYRLTTSNACGSYSHDYRFDANGFICGGSQEERMVTNISSSLLISPNPGSGTIFISLRNRQNEESIQAVLIKDKKGLTVQGAQFKNRNFREPLNVQNLPPDVYIIQVYTGRKWLTSKFIKQ